MDLRDLDYEKMGQIALKCTLACAGAATLLFACYLHEIIILIIAALKKRR